MQLNYPRSLLLTILGELNVVRGESLCFSGPVAYCGHDSWILNASARDNILVARATGETDEVRYDEVVRSCALQEDFKLWRDGDSSLLGQKGINISGGQKARIALARALYSEASVLLLDNILAGLDVSTATFVFHEAILTACSKRVVLLCTHVPQFYQFASGIIQVNEGMAVLVEQEPSVMRVSTSDLEPQGALGSRTTVENNAKFIDIPPIEINSYFEYFKVNRCFKIASKLPCFCRRQEAI